MNLLYIYIHIYLKTFATDSCKQKYVQGFPLLCFGLYGGICSVILQTLIRACQPNGILFKSTNALAQEGRHKGAKYSLGLTPQLQVSLLVRGLQTLISLFQSNISCEYCI